MKTFNEIRIGLFKLLFLLLIIINQAIATPIKKESVKLLNFDLVDLHFKCAILAQNIENKAERRRHFTLGYKHSIRLLKNVLENKVPPDLSLIESLKLLKITSVLDVKAQSLDFAIGRLYEDRNNFIFKQYELIKKSSKSSYSFTEFSQNEFNKTSCEFINK